MSIFLIRERKPKEEQYYFALLHHDLSMLNVGEYLNELYDDLDRNTRLIHNTVKYTSHVQQLESWFVWVKKKYNVMVTIDDDEVTFFKL